MFWRQANTDVFISIFFWLFNHVFCFVVLMEYRRKCVPSFPSINQLTIQLFLHFFIPFGLWKRGNLGKQRKKPIQLNGMFLKFTQFQILFCNICLLLTVRYMLPEYMFRYFCHHCNRRISSYCPSHIAKITAISVFKIFLFIFFPKLILTINVP